MKQYRQFLTGWTLVALLLFGQMYLIAHESGHESTLIDAYCQICLSTSALNGAAPPPALNIETDRHSGILIRPLHPERIPTYSVTAEPRAPPLFS